MSRLLRIQDAEGRGPWRPGFSQMWIDPEKDDSFCPPLMVEFPNWHKAIAKARKTGRPHVGCVAYGAQGLHAWFTPSEIGKLRAFGFRLADASSLTRILSGRHQAIVASALPLSMLPDADWP